MMQAKRGFTLVELLVVIAIIGALGTIAMFGFGGTRAKSRDAKRVADMNTLIKGMALMESDEIEIYQCTDDTDARILDICQPNGIINFTRMVDPLVGTEASVCSFNLEEITEPCRYNFTSPVSAYHNGTAASFRVTFYLEEGIAGLAPGGHAATASGIE